MRFGWNNEGLSSLAVMMREEGGIFGKRRGILSFLNPDSMGFKGSWSFGRDMQAAFTGKDTVIFVPGLEYAASCRHNDGWWPCKPDFVTANFAGRFLSGEILCGWSAYAISQFGMGLVCICIAFGHAAILTAEWQYRFCRFESAVSGYFGLNAV